MNADRRNRPPSPRWLGRLLEPMYRRAVADRNRRFDAGENVHRLPVPVISVGNLSVGGTGKTPTVMRIVEIARDAGHRPCIAMRGYRRGDAAHSDEQAEYAARFPDVPVVAQPDRLAGLERLRSAQPDAFDCVILDDGFQHRRIARDLDVVLIDATRDVFSDRCLPAGWLREPVESLERADAVIVTHAEAVVPAVIASMLDRVRRFAPRATLSVARHEWQHLRGANETRSLDWLTGRTVAVACGIGHPTAFLAAAERAGATCPVKVIRGDHHAWKPADLRELASARVDAILTTEKDWVKLAPITHDWTGPAFVRPELAMTIDDGREEFVRRVHHTLETGSAARRSDAPPATVSA